MEMTSLPPNNNLPKRSIMVRGKLNFIAAVVCALWVAWTVMDYGSGHYEESQYFDQTFSVLGRVQVSLENVKGGIEIGGVTGSSKGPGRYSLSSGKRPHFLSSELPEACLQ